MVGQGGAKEYMSGNERLIYEVHTSSPEGDADVYLARVFCPSIPRGNKLCSNYVTHVTDHSPRDSFRLFSSFGLIMPLFKLEATIRIP